MTPPEQISWPRIRNLPEAERQPFIEFLVGQTVPWIEGEPMGDQDAYYPWDYDNFKRKTQNRYFD